MYYKLSGRFSIGGAASGFFSGCAAAVVLGYIYGRGSILVPYDQLAFLATIAFGAAIGAAAGYGLVLGKVRNQAINLMVQAVATTFGLYLSWAAWVADILQRFGVDDPGWTELARNPARLWEAINYINQSGTWKLENESGPTRGTHLWLIWIAEAGLVIGVGMAIGYGILRRHPFCERCESWCTPSAKLILTAPTNSKILKGQLEAKNWSSLETLGIGDKKYEHLKVEVHSCEQCRQLNTMSVTHTFVRVNWIRQKKITQTEIVQHLLIDASQAEKLKQLWPTGPRAIKLASDNVRATAAGKR